ncbi:MAG TPA: phosphatidylserine decarboxylase, partial [Candidatus Deferrimicrobium sp.]
MNGKKGPMLAPEGWPFVLGGAAFAVVVFLLWPRGIPLAALGLLLSLFSLWFFRNPDRTPPSGTGVVVSPADGRIVYAGESPPGRYALVAGKRVSVFMSPVDVHVNRAPVTGRVASVR